MGLLDEAIREHLELKRRHGADATEIAKLENEVLGPGHTETAAATPASAADVQDETHEVTAPEHEVHEAHDALEEYDEPVAAAPASASIYAPPPLPEPEVEPEPEMRHVPAPPASSEPDTDQSTVAFSLDELEDAEQPDKAAAEEEEPGEHDELEETPEFLQETPEHDRMWFEQKPPRDFDF